ncbi:hypothetical protein [Modestobacter sp. VKM Ac-2984]|uniref:hypothetical protein n=1 Tax=Modestobacter sp. VKM Ac-2984 TaxID=3004138 RepID=UPI0022AA92F4|nr:hypothetical protein [Modestobacter sp. VKM Ac-2984]MCZ2816151.1 hypothetical protein [Modestobacter sp. VKM Ac-2984]
MLARGQPVERIVLPPSAGDQEAHDLGVEDGASIAPAPNGTDPAVELAKAVVDELYAD